MQPWRGRHGNGTEKASTVTSMQASAFVELKRPMIKASKSNALPASRCTLSCTSHSGLILLKRTPIFCFAVVCIPICIPIFVSMHPNLHPNFCMHASQFASQFLHPRIPICIPIFSSTHPNLHPKIQCHKSQSRRLISPARIPIVNPTRHKETRFGIC